MSESHRLEVERWRADRDTRLRSPDGWLSLVGLSWLQEGDNLVGTDPSCRVRLPAAGVTGIVGTIRLEGGTATFRPHDGAGGTSEVRPVPEPILLEDDAGGRRPTVLRVGPITLSVIDREGEKAVRVRDSGSPALASFRGMSYFPIDPSWRLQARFEPFDPPRTPLVPNVLGRAETYLSPGALAFDVAGVTHRLDAFREAGGDDLFVAFADATNGEETYGGGRYLHAPLPDAAGRVILDFNLAYNPPCVFTPFATCVLPLPQNRLPFRVEAGEKRYEGEIDARGGYW
jgi:uncharacterized protein (DUF1684 family)